MATMPWVLQGHAGRRASQQQHPVRPHMPHRLHAGRDAALVCWLVLAAFKRLPATQEVACQPWGSLRLGECPDWP